MGFVHANGSAVSFPVAMPKLSALGVSRIAASSCSAAGKLEGLGTKLPKALKALFDTDNDLKSVSSRRHGTDAACNDVSRQLPLSGVGRDIMLEPNRYTNAHLEIPSHTALVNDSTVWRFARHLACANSRTSSLLQLGFFRDATTKTPQLVNSTQFCVLGPYQFFGGYLAWRCYRFWDKTPSVGTGEFDQVLCKVPIHAPLLTRLAVR